MLTPPLLNLKSYTFKASVWQWKSESGSDKGSWYFVSVPENISKKVAVDTADRPRKSFGSAPV